MLVGTPWARLTTATEFSTIDYRIPCGKLGPQYPTGNGSSCGGSSETKNQKETLYLLGAKVLAFLQRRRGSKTNFPFGVNVFPCSGGTLLLLHR